MYLRTKMIRLLTIAVTTSACSMATDFKSDDAAVTAGATSKATTMGRGGGTENLRGGASNRPATSASHNIVAGGTDSSRIDTGLTSSTAIGGSPSSAGVESVNVGGSTQNASVGSSSSSTSSSAGGTLALGDTRNVTTAGGMTGGATTAATGGATTAATGGATTAATGGATTASTTSASGGLINATTGGTTTATTGGSATGGTTAVVTTTAGDTVRPSVASVSPASGESGVTSDRAITVNFSEPMDKNSVSSALSVSGLLSGDLTLQWNSDATSLTITPKSGLSYANGTSTSGTSARTYTVTIGTGARDLAANTMAAAYSSNFSTLRRITQYVSAEGVYTFNTYEWGTGTGPSDCADFLRIGGWSGSYSGGTYLAFIVFDISSLGSAYDMYSIESAMFAGSQTSVDGDFYNGRAVKVSKIDYDSQIYYSYFNDITAELGTFSSTASTGAKRLEILPAFKSDFQEGNSRQMYRVEPTTGGWKGNMYANFSCSFGLEVTYLIK